MPLKDIVTVNISLQTTGVSRTGFGVPIFMGAHRWFTQRVASFNSLDDASGIIPTDSEEYKALTRFFSQNPRPSIVKIGRMEADIDVSFANVEEGEQFSISVSDGTNEVVASHIVGAADDAEAIVDALILAIDGDVDISAVVNATKNGTGDAATLTLSPVNSGDEFSITNKSENVVTEGTTTSTAASDYEAVTQEDGDFYFVTASDHSPEFVEDMAEIIEASEKMYFFSVAEASSLTPYSDSSSDILATIKQANYLKTVGLFHHLADTEFPECAFVGKGAPYQPGTITWSHKQLAGVPVSRNPNTEHPLTTTELNNLSDRNANFVYTMAGVDIVREGKTLGGEFIDIIRSRDFLVARVREAFQNKFINTNKVPYTDSGINSLRSVLESVLARYVSTEATPNILQENNPYTTDFPAASEVSFADKQARELTASFTAFLAGAIHVIEINGVLTLDAE